MRPTRASLQPAGLAGNPDQSSGRLPRLRHRFSSDGNVLATGDDRDAYQPTREAAIADLREALEGLIAEFGALEELTLQALLNDLAPAPARTRPAGGAG
jgi:hypothetical protein